MASPSARAGCCRATDDEWALSGENGQETLVGCVEDLMSAIWSVKVNVLLNKPCIPPDVVNIVLLYTIGVCSIRAHGMNRKISLYVVDDEWWVVDVPHARSRRRPQVAGGAWGRCGSCSIPRCLGAGRSAGRSSFGGVCHVEALREVEDHIAHLAWQGERRMNRVHSNVARTARSDTEGGDLRHINPNAGEWHLLVPLDELLNPP